MLIWILTGFVSANFDTFNETDYDYPDDIGNYGDTTDVELVNCTYKCSKHLYFQCVKTEEGKTEPCFEKKPECLLHTFLHNL